MKPYSQTKIRWLTGLLLFVVVALRLPAADDLQFNRDIRPILSDKCFQCHGPDDDARQADLRLDTRAGLFEKRDEHVAFAAGRVDQSEALRRILSNDADERMPPPTSKKTLTAKQIATLRTWVEQGAKWETHWAFEKPRRADLPAVKNTTWPRNEIDRFVLARMEQLGITPSPPADALMLVRRVSLDLIGLPPTPEEADEWVARLTGTSGDSFNETVYGELVDHLLNSKQYGERWARRWLDLARYADTNGYEKDRDRNIWPYRDWVIKALNDDMPFDQFTIEQLAGDMLPQATIEQRVATGFHRNTMLNEEGGIDPLEFRFHAMTDRVATTGTTWLGLTIGCAQCHSHKFDPISQREYYQFMAFLNNADEPTMDLPSEAIDAQRREDLARAEQLLRELPGHWPVAEGQDRNQLIDQRYAEWLAQERRRTVDWTPIRPTKMKSNLPHLALEDDDSIFSSGDTAKHDTFELVFARDVRDITAVRIEALPDERLPAHGPGSTYYEGTIGDFFLSEFQLWADGAKQKFSKATHSYAKNRFGNNPVAAELAIDGDLQTGWSVHDRQGERHVAVFVLERPIASAGELRMQMDFGRHFASSLGRFRVSITQHPGGAEARDLPLEIEALLSLADEQLSADQRGRLREEFLLHAPELAKHSEPVLKLRQPVAYPTTLVMHERPENNPRPTAIHHRGEFLQPTERVAPGTPAVLHPLANAASKDRLAFARWLVSSDNPLTARVTVNRAWAALFGQGIVPTVDDFGFQGQPPSHPELLDWLAVTFQTGADVKLNGQDRHGLGWSLKKLHKLIVMSATYRQSSRHAPRDEVHHAERDGYNLARAPRFRLEAEIVRDATLRAAGILSANIGGPPVRPPQPDGITEAAYGKPQWQASTGADRYRRSVYTFIKRTAPFAMFNTFDAPSGEACVARRDVSNTALQSLTLLNDVMFVEAAQAMGRMIAARDGDDRQRAAYAFRRVMTRPPTDDELTKLVEFVTTQRTRIASGELDAKTIAGEGPGDMNERAVWTTLARALFSLDEAVTRQ